MLPMIFKASGASYYSIPEIICGRCYMVRIHSQYIFSPFFLFTAFWGTDAIIDGAIFRSSFFRWRSIRKFLPLISVKIFIDILICRHHIKVHPRHTGNSLKHFPTFLDLKQRLGYPTNPRYPHIDTSNSRSTFVTKPSLRHNTLSY